MAGSSPGRASNSSGRASQVTSPQVYLPTTGRIASRSGTGSRGSPVSLQLPPTPVYVSPYPLLPSTDSTGRSITATTGIPSSSSSTTSGTTPSSREERQPVREPSVEQTLLRPPFGIAPGGRSIPQAQKEALIAALNEHRINTIGELRRVERIFAELGSPDLTQPMTAAWVYYVNSNSLLTELRSLTRNYPFSSECLDEAKRRVHQDPASNRSWNYCWLVLAKTHTDRLIPLYARTQAARPEMWGGRIPLQQSVNQLAEAFVNEWNAALAQLLRYWEIAPIR